jgi:CRISPR-associated endoribonuclease Cas6
MRLLLTLDITGKNNVLPINYQYELSSWIYKVLNFGDKDFTNWLHDKGFISDKKRFKLFTFSNLIVEKHKVEGDRLILGNRKASVIVSFYPVEMFEPFVMGIFKERKFGLGDKQSVVDFVVSQVEKLPEPEFTDDMCFSSISPIHVTWRNDEGLIEHLAPGHPEYATLLFGNLYSKYEAYQQFRNQKAELFDLSKCYFDTINNPKRKVITIKSNTVQQSKIAAYSFNFRIQAPVSLLRIGYFSGFGKANSQGCGCIEVINNI